MRRARLLVPVAAGVLGLAAGAVTGLTTAADDGEDGSPRADPLGLGIPYADLDCTGQSVLVVARGGSAAPLLGAIANDADVALRYLRPDRSCDTLWAPPTEEPPQYVVYAGPYDQPTAPCELRMSPDHKRDAVTRLAAGNETFVKCLCVLPVATFPDLTPGMAVDPGSGIWVRSLQGLLADLDDQREADGEPGPYFRRAAVTGVYDDATQARIEAYQPERDIAAEEYGSVRADTWRALTDDACALYDF